LEQQQEQQQHQLKPEEHALQQNHPSVSVFAFGVGTVSAGA
jgi:hypothetical protein